MGQRCVPYTVFKCLEMGCNALRLHSLALLGHKCSSTGMTHVWSWMVAPDARCGGSSLLTAQSCASPDVHRLQIDHMKMDIVNKNGLRGVVATKDFKAGEVLAHIPAKCTIDVGPYTMPGAVRGNCWTPVNPGTDLPRPFIVAVENSCVPVSDAAMPDAQRDCRAILICMSFSRHQARRRCRGYVGVSS